METMLMRIEHNWGMDGYAWIFGIVIIAVLIYTFIKLRKQASDAEASQGRSTQDPLKEKYERDEISREEYERRKRKR